MQFNLKINGTDFSPAFNSIGYGVSYLKIEGDNGGTTLDGTLVEDVLARWMAEKECVGSVGRVLPKEYLYFTGDGVHNYFTTEWQGGQTWDWSLESPYEG